MDAEVGQGPPGRQARVHAAELQLLHQRDGLRATSSTPSTCSPTRDGSCCRCTASIPTPACGSTAAARPTRRRACATSPPRSMARRRAWPPRPRACWPASSRPRGEIIAAARRAPAGRAAARPGAQRGLRAHPLVPAPGGGARAAADLRAHRPFARPWLAFRRGRRGPPQSQRGVVPGQGGTCSSASWGPSKRLGPDGRVVSVRGQPLRLLGLLLVRRGEPVAADSAIDALWGEGLPANPANALQVRRLAAARGRGRRGDRLARRRLRARARRPRGGRRRSLRPPGRRGRGRPRPRRRPPPRPTRCHAAMALWRGPALHERALRVVRRRPRSRAWRSCASPASARASRPTSPWAATSRCSASSRRSSPSIRCASRCGCSSSGRWSAAGAGPRRSSRRARRAAGAGRRPRARAVAGARRAARRRAGRARRCRRAARWSASRRTCAAPRAAGRSIRRCSRT